MQCGSRSKKCSICKVEKEIAEYNKNKTKKDGFQTMCKICSRARSKKYYNENTAKHKNVVRVRRKEDKDKSRAFILDFLSENSCVDCGESNVACLEFDHIRGKKLSNISTLLSFGSKLEIVKLEIAKCDVRCANCHKIRHAVENNWYKQNSKIIIK